MGNIPISKGLANWIDDFVLGLSKNKENKTSKMDKMAEININDLPKVVWNDETFYVLFDNEAGSATIFNEFTNIVTTLEAKTIEEVDTLLNSKQIVNSKNDDSLKCDSDLSDFEKELNKLANGDFTNSTPEVVPPTTVETPQTTPEVNVEIKTAELLEKISVLEETIVELTNEISTLKEQQYARTEETVDLDLNVEQMEQDHYNESALETEESIDMDSNYDITTPQGRTDLSLKERILNDLNEITGFEDEVLENEIDTLSKEELEIVEDYGIDEELSNHNVETKPLESEDILEEVEIEDETVEIDEEIEIEDEISEDDDVVMLSEEDSEVFKTATCPYCSGELVKANKAGFFQGIVCTGKCESEFAVNLNTGEIFVK